MTALVISRTRSRQVRVAFAVVTSALLVGYLMLHHSSVEAGTDAVYVADRDWIAIGACCAVLTWLAATGSQLGAIDGPVPISRLFATQVASSFISHVLPAGVGQVGLNARFLRRSGLSSEQVASAVALNAVAGAGVHAVALLVLLAVFGAPAHVVNGSLLLVVIAAMIVLGLATTVTLTHLGRGATPAGARVRSALGHARAALHRPRRAALLVGGSVALLMLHIATLVAVLQALHQSLPVGTVAVIYLACSAAGAALPGPGGFGGFDVLLASALLATGMTASVAAGAVIAYRSLTVWLPMLPSAATLVVMVHRKIV